MRNRQKADCKIRVNLTLSREGGRVKPIFGSLLEKPDLGIAAG